ncbi:MAG TPA: hypothetical protein VHR45_15030 [Thermoanaerobaculia bacterium]|nr:hypothetical protein [Thermoanaerobaculia bacterium]
MRESSAYRVASILRADPELSIWWGTPVECAGALARAARTGEIDERFQRAARRSLSDLLGRSDEVPPTQELRQLAVRLVGIHALRAADALQLAAARDWCDERTAGIGFVCLDDRLRTAAIREGFDVLPSAEEVHEP